MELNEELLHVRAIVNAALRPLVTQTKPMFGHYRCYRCHKKWFSSHAWCSMTQQCMKCGAQVLPTNLQKVQPTYEFTFKCQNSCNNMHTTQSQRVLPTELAEIFRTEELVLCNELDKAYYKKKCRVLIDADGLITECFAKCNHCNKQHRVKTCFQMKQMHLPKQMCQKCNKRCCLVQISKNEPNLTIPHRQDLCEMCKKLKKYCGASSHVT